MKKRGVQGYSINLLKLTPVRNIDWKEENGLIILLKPKFKHSLFQKYILPKMRNPYFKVKLDSVGSFIWKHCDGNLTVKELAKGLKDEFGDKLEPLYDRLALFLQNLEKNRFIYYKRNF
ncbi:MAG: PqqD family protein [Candidatus Aminicenantaceae bacterium]